MAISPLLIAISPLSDYCNPLSKFFTISLIIVKILLVTSNCFIYK